MKVVNVSGYTFKLSMVNKRSDMTQLEIKGRKLFSTYQFLSEDDIHKVLTPFSILKTLNADSFENYCKSMPSDVKSSISINFLIFDSFENKFIEESYTVHFSSKGIMKETLSGIVLKRDHPFLSSLPYDIFEYFRLMFIYDMKDEACINSMMSLFKSSLSNLSFVKFFIKFVEVGDFKIVNIFQQNSIYYVKNSNCDIEELDSMPDSFIALCCISWIFFILFIKTGVCVIANFDDKLDVKTVDSILSMFMNIEESTKRNDCQFLFTSSNDYPIAQEQIMKVKNNNEYLICEWQQNY